MTTPEPDGQQLAPEQLDNVVGGGLELEWHPNGFELIDTETGQNYGVFPSVEAAREFVFQHILGTI
jgi:hypothetical protein